MAAWIGSAWPGRRLGVVRDPDVGLVVEPEVLFTVDVQQRQPSGNTYRPVSGNAIPTHPSHSATVPLIRSRDLETAMREASEAAVAGEVVLLSPACASFDQFRDFEDRGDQFRDLVGAL